MHILVKVVGERLNSAVTKEAAIVRRHKGQRRYLLPLESGAH